MSKDVGALVVSPRDGGVRKFALVIIKGRITSYIRFLSFTQQVYFPLETPYGLFEPEQSSLFELSLN